MTASSSARALGIGVAGLGRAFTLMLPTFLADQRVRLVAATDPREEACARFRKDFSNAEFTARTCDSIDALCADPSVDVIYLATPHQLHAEHVQVAARYGKHLLVEKPIALSLAECDAMIAATRAANVHLIVGHSHSFDAPILMARDIIESGEAGTVRMISAQIYTDFLYRPRRPEELDTARGGGVVFSQGAHQIDIVRLLGGGMVRTVRALTGAWDAARGAGGKSAEGAYAALLTFENGAFASILYNGYGFYDSDEACDWIGELGSVKTPEAYQSGRLRLSAARDAEHEAELKAARNYGGANYAPPGAAPPHHQHFGPMLISCDRADLKPTPHGVMVYGEREKFLRPAPRAIVPRVEVIDELAAAVVDGIPPLHDGAWSRATLEVCLALLESARTGCEITLRYQVPPRHLNRT
jgi:phthalate 4,5-cis-dihydrodiol dehydrogenase